MPTVTLSHSRAVQCLLTKIRDEKTNQAEFVHYSDRLMRLVVEEGLAHLPSVKSTSIETPCGPCDGLEYDYDESMLCAVSIIRSGNALLEAVRQIVPSISVGHVLVQRNESDEKKRPVFFYSKFPSDIAKRMIFLVDPMLATGGSANAALQCLIDAGVLPSRILLLTVISAPEGIAEVMKSFPAVQIVCAHVDQHLNKDKFIVPGLGDFGDRYYNTCEPPPEKKARHNGWDAKLKDSAHANV